MIRSGISVVAGLLGFMLATAALWAVFGYSGQDTPPNRFLLGSLVCEVLFSLGAGYLTALIAGRREGAHSFALAVVMALQGVASLVLAPDLYPTWVPLSTILILSPCCYLGGRFRGWLSEGPTSL